MEHTLLPHRFIGFVQGSYDYFTFKQNTSANIFQIKDFSKKVAVDIASLGFMTGEIIVNQESTLGSNYFMAITDKNERMIKYEEYTTDNYANSIVDFFVTAKNGQVYVNLNKIRQIFGDNIKIMLSVSEDSPINLLNNNGVESNLKMDTVVTENKIISGMDSNHNVTFVDKAGYNVYTISLPYPTYADFFYVTLDKNMKRTGGVDDALTIFKQLFQIDKKYIEFSEKEIIFDLPKIKNDFGDLADTFNLQIPNLPNDVIIHQCNPLEYDENPRLILPPVIPGINGLEKRLYYQNAKYTMGSDFDVVVPGTSIVGGAMVYTPNGDWNMNLYKYFRGSKEKYSILSKGISTSSTPSISNAKVMLLGESTTNAAEFRAQLQKLINSDTNLGATLVGSMGAGTNSDPKHEGYSGWNTDKILNTKTFNGFTNAFYNPNTSAFDLDYYFNNTGVAIPDVVYIAFGINDIASSKNEDKINIIKNIQKMMDAFYDKNKNIRFVLGLSNLPSNFEQYENTTQYEATRGMLRAIERMIAIYGYSQRVTLAPLYMSLHRKWHMQYSQQPVIEFSDVKEYYGTNNVHPQYLGYDMTASMAYAAIRYSLSKSL